MINHINQTSYEQVLNSLTSHYAQKKVGPEQTDLWRLFVFFAANCRHFLGLDNLAEQQSLFARVRMNQQLSIWEDANYIHLPKEATTGLDEHWWQQLRREPGIICTFHTGSYRLINHLLLKQRIDFALLVSGKVKQRDGADFEQRYQEDVAGGKTLTVLNAEDPSVLFKLRRLLQQGKSLLAYVDGNTGSGSNGIAIPFFGKDVVVRKGLPMLAHWLDVPIYPLANIRKNEVLTFYALSRIKSSKCKDKHDFALETMQRLYGFLEYTINDYVDQWEGWLHLHHAVNQQFGGEPLLLDLIENADQNAPLLPFELNGRAFAFNPLTYGSYPISRDVYYQMLNYFR
jgi:lauroyl/myristoyl acyltransferase